MANIHRKIEKLYTTGLTDGIDFEVKVSEADETIAPGTKPHEAVEELSYRKAKAVWDLLEEKEIVIGSDTVVVFQEKILGKPRDEKEAKERQKQIIKILLEV